MPRPTSLPAMALGMTVVSRLRKDAALRTVPGPRPAGKRGRPRIYGPDVIDLARRGGQRRGWSTGTMIYLYGVAVRSRSTRRSWRPRRRRPGRSGGPGRRAGRLAAYFCTDTSASVADILGAVADRFGLETAFRECKQVVGAGQQVRSLWANVGAFHICPWTFTRSRRGPGAGMRPPWWIDRPPRGTENPAARATRTSGMPGGATCWARRFVRPYARGRPRRKFRPPPKGCSAWPHNSNRFPESTGSR
ncbi:MAG: hypothetical protein U0800_07945 [Isosphaeraceae bacterium]